MAYLRAAEFTVSGVVFDESKNLCVSDIQFISSPTHYVILKIKNSKTDKFNSGVEISIGCSDHEICAVCALEQYLECRYTVLPPNASDPLFVTRTGHALTKHLFNSNLKLVLSLAGIDPSHYSGHSLRAGGATDAALSGMPDWEIKMIGRWSSSAYYRYIRIPLADRARSCKRLAKAGGQEKISY